MKSIYFGLNTNFTNGCYNILLIGSDGNEFEVGNKAVIFIFLNKFVLKFIIPLLCSILKI